MKVIIIHVDLKTAAGGGDTDKNAHQKFDSWDEGVQAHMDHLALYAGANGYPKNNTYDPRHFVTIKGKATTVNSLGGLNGLQVLHMVRK